MTFAAALRLAGRIDSVNRQMAFVVRWGLLANAVLIAGNAFSRKLLGVASSMHVRRAPSWPSAACSASSPAACWWPP